MNKTIKTKKKILEALEDEKTKKETEEELYRILNTMEKSDLVDLIVSDMNYEEKLNFIKEWNNY